MIKIVKVRGASMAPTLASGDYVILTKARTMRPGFVILVDHPKYGPIIKRVKSINDGKINLEGDGPESTSADALGQVNQAAVKGRARWAIKPKGLMRL